MNRRERKLMEKRLGLDKYKKSLPRAQRFEMMRQNIESGNKMQEQMKETKRLQENQKSDSIASARISYIATDLMINKGMDWVSAQAEAVEVYKREVESVSPKE
jgi:hypothetical protein